MLKLTNTHNRIWRVPVSPERDWRECSNWNCAWCQLLSGETLSCALFLCVPSLHPIKVCVCAGERCENESLSLRGGLVLVAAAKIYGHPPRYLLLSVLCTAQIRLTLYSASLFPPLPFCTALYNGCDCGAIHPFIQSVCGVIVTALLLFGLLFSHSFSLILCLPFDCTFYSLVLY